jgi:hypothetical protein
MRHRNAPTLDATQGSSLTRKASATAKAIEDMTMKTFVTALAATMVMATLAVPAGAAPRERDRNGSAGYRQDRPCVVTGWTDWSLTKPIFKCPDANEPAVNHRHRNGR